MWMRRDINRASLVPRVSSVLAGAALFAVACSSVARCAAQEADAETGSAQSTQEETPQVAAPVTTPVPASSESAALPSQTTIERWLGSNNPRLVAWGARDAMLIQDRSAVPQLLSLPNHWQPLPRDGGNADALTSRTYEERDAMANVLDALLQMNVALPADSLLALAPDFETDVAVFLARMPADESADLRMKIFESKQLEQHAPALYYTDAALLALHPQPGFAASLMGGINVRANLVVILPDRLATGWGSAIDCGLGAPLPRPGWPEIARYNLSFAKSAESTQIVGGIDPIYAHRVMANDYQSNQCGTGVYLGAEQRRRFVAEMAGVKPEALGWEVELNWTIAYRSRAQFEAELLALVNGEIEKQRATASALTDRNLLVVGDVSDALPKIYLAIEDQRGEGPEPLVEPANLPSHVVWGP
jgi:hypothetical protein